MNHPDRQLTVQDLILKLIKCPLSALVILEGCDCEGEAMGVDYHATPSDENELVMITRSKGNIE